MFTVVLILRSRGRTVVALFICVLLAASRAAGKTDICKQEVKKVRASGVRVSCEGLNAR